MNIRDNLAAVERRIGEACERSGRARSEVTLIAVAKTFPVDAVREVIAAGVTDVGENRAQELREKAAVLGSACRWHFIGPLQTNKVRHVVGTASLIHSVDRIGLAEAIARRARAAAITQDVLVEVNIAGERSKTGVEPPRAVAFATEIAGLDGIRVRGLMTIPPAASHPGDSRPFLKELADLGRVLTARLPDAGLLSMGMTSDFDIAIEEGATHVRVGTAIFGGRTR